MKKYCFLALLTMVPAAAAPPLTGLWDGKLTVAAAQVPFRVQFQGEGDNFKAWFFNGDEKVVSTSGQSTATSVLAKFAQYNSRLEATLKDGALDGAYTRDGKVYPVHAVPHKTPPPPGGPVPKIAGVWLVETGVEKGEKAWSLQLRQNGPDLTGALLRVDGDTGVLTGRFEDGHFTLSHFSGARPVVFVLTPGKDDTLDVLQNNTRKLVAVRETVARRKGIAPEDPMAHITMKDPKQPLAFTFPDLSGKMISLSDARFKGKVVIVSIGGSWCPNCHDEAPLLVSLYKKFHAKGLEIVELSFEEEEQQKDPTRLREFIHDYGIEYTVLIAGEPAQLAEKLPQAANLDTFPATLFVGRDGLVKSTHAGFAGKATGAQHEHLVEEINATVTRLIAEK